MVELRSVDGRPTITLPYLYDHGNICVEYWCGLEKSLVIISVSTKVINAHMFVILRIMIALRPCSLAALKVFHPFCFLYEWFNGFKFVHSRARRHDTIYRNLGLNNKIY